MVEIHLKRGQAHNELTRFRYDVILRTSKASAQDLDCPWVHWQKVSFSLDLVRETLRTARPDMLA